MSTPQPTGSRSLMRFKVVLIPFPFDDLSGQKVRPAVCLTDALGPRRHLVVAFITSNLPTTLEPTDILLDPGTPDFASTGLRGAVRVRLHRLVTVSTAIIQRQIGVLAPGLQGTVRSSRGGNRPMPAPFQEWTRFLNIPTSSRGCTERCIPTSAKPCRRGCRRPTSPKSTSGYGSRRRRGTSNRIRPSSRASMTSAPRPAAWPWRRGRSRWSSR